MLAVGAGLCLARPGGDGLVDQLNRVAAILGADHASSSPQIAAA
jgi:hypothetical protein